MATEGEASFVREPSAAGGSAAVVRPTHTPTTTDTPTTKGTITEIRMTLSG